MIEVSRVEEDIKTRYQRGVMKLGVKELYETEEEVKCTQN